MTLPLHPLPACTAAFQDASPILPSPLPSPSTLLQPLQLLYNRNNFFLQELTFEPVS